MNLNTLVSQIFTRYVGWWRYAEKLKFLPTSKDLLRELFQAIGKEQLVKIGARLGESHAPEEVLFLFRQINPATVLRFIDLWSSHFDACERHIDSRRCYFTIHHDVNMNFSLFTKEYLSAMVQSTLGKSVQFEKVSPNSISFNFES